MMSRAGRTTINSSKAARWRSWRCVRIGRRTSTSRRSGRRSGAATTTSPRTGTSSRCLSAPRSEPSINQLRPDLHRGQAHLRPHLDLDAFAAAFVAVARGARLGAGDEPGVALGPVQNRPAVRTREGADRRHATRRSSLPARWRGTRAARLLHPAGDRRQPARRRPRRRRGAVRPGGAAAQHRRVNRRRLRPR